MATPVQKLSYAFTFFVFNTLKGFESGLFKGITLNLMKSLSLEDLRTPKALFVLVEFATHYMNQCYVALIRRDDDYIVSRFDAMTKPFGHSEICLLNLVMFWVKNIFMTLDRSKLKVDGSVEEYLRSYDKAFQPFLTAMIVMLGQTLNHQCQGIDIRTCDPNQPMFSFTLEPVFSKK